MVDIYHCKNYLVKKKTHRVVTPVSGFIELMRIYYKENFNTDYRPALPHNSRSKELAQTLVC